MISFVVSNIDRYRATLVTFEIESGITEPDEAFSVELPKVALDRGVILSGRGPVWLFARLVHHYHPARWIAVCDPRIGYIVVQSHSKEYTEGEVLEI